MSVLLPACGPFDSVGAETGTETAGESATSTGEATSSSEAETAEASSSEAGNGDGDGDGEAEATSGVVDGDGDVAALILFDNLPAPLSPHFPIPQRPSSLNQIQSPASYREDGWTACDRDKLPNGKHPTSANRQQVTLGLNDAGMLVEVARSDSDQSKICEQLASTPTRASPLSRR